MKHKKSIAAAALCAGMALLFAAAISIAKHCDKKAQKKTEYGEWFNNDKK
jgi:hypothetical protein